MKQLRALLSIAAVGALTVVFSVGTLLHGGLLKDTEQKIPFRSRLLQAQQSISLASGMDCIRGVYLTDKRLILQHESYLTEQVEANIAAVNGYASACTAPFFWMTAPTAAGIYADTLPVGANQASEQVLLETAQKLKNEHITWIDLHGILYDARDSYIYYRNDRRWTTYGAFCAYKAAIRSLGFGNLGLDRYVNTHYSSDFRGDLYDISGYDKLDADMIDIYNCENGAGIASIIGVKSGNQYTSLYQTELPENADPYAVFLPETEPILQIETEVHNNKRLVVLCDGFGSNFVPFLTQHYHSLEIINFTNAAAEEIPTVADDGNTQVLLLCSADTLAKANGIRLPAAPAVK